MKSVAVEGVGRMHPQTKSFTYFMQAENEGSYVDGRCGCNNYKEHKTNNGIKEALTPLTPEM